MSLIRPVIVEQLSMTYPGASSASVQQISLSLPEGAIVALVGPNGSGKSTFLRLLVGLLEPSAGQVRVLGKTPRPGASVMRQIGYLASGDRFFPELTVIENLIYRATIRGFSIARATELAQASVRDLGLHNVAHLLPGKLSSGQSQRALLASALTHQPQVLLLDEPTTALDIASLASVHSILHALPKRGHTVVMATHHCDEVWALSDYLLLLREGRAVHYGPTRKLASTAEGLRDYLFDAIAEPPSCAA